MQISQIKISDNPYSNDNSVKFNTLGNHLYTSLAIVYLAEGNIRVHYQPLHRGRSVQHNLMGNRNYKR